VGETEIRIVCKDVTDPADPAAAQYHVAASPYSVFFFFKLKGSTRGFFVFEDFLFL
jgi:hypothetical protein